MRTVRLAAEPASSALARALVRRWCGEWGLASAVVPVEVVVTELVENAVRHVGSGAELTVRAVDRTVTVSVGDPGTGGMPRVRHPAPDESGGRGMQLVDTMALRWGVDRCAAGKRVWAIIAAG